MATNISNADLFGEDTVQRAPNEQSVASTGLRQGARLVGAGAAALAGTAAEAMGARDTAQRMYDTRRGLRDSMAAAPQNPVQSYTQIHSVGDAASYAVNLAAQGALPLAAGLVGGALTRNPMVGATLATAPFEAGAIANEQQEDPVAASKGAGARLAYAAGGGLQAAARAAMVPGMFEGKVLGRGVAEGLRGGMAKNLALAGAGNAAGSAGAQLVHQHAASALNPERDTSGDNAALMEAAVGGGMTALPFGAVGAVADTAHGANAGAKARFSGLADTLAPTKLKETITGALKGPGESAGTGAEVPNAAQSTGSTADAVSSAMGKAKGFLGRMFQRDEAAAADREASKIAAGEETVDPKAFEGTSPEQHAEILDKADADRIEKVRGMADAMLNDDRLSPESKKTVQDMLSRIDTPRGQAEIAGRYLAHKGAQHFADSVTALGEHFSPLVEKLRGKVEGADVKKSEMSEGVRRVITDTIMPMLQESDVWSPGPSLKSSVSDDVVHKLGSTIKNVLSVLNDGEHTVSESDVARLRSVFGNKTGKVFTALGAALGEDRASGIDKEAFYRNLNRINELDDQHQSLRKVVQDNLPEDVAGDYKPSQYEDTITAIRQFTDGSATRRMGAEEARAMQRQFMEAMRAEFGDKADGVLQAFQKDAEQRHAGEQDLDELRNEDGHVETHGAEDALDMRYVGGKNNEPIPSEAFHRELYGNENSQVSRLMEKARAEFPEHNVDFVSLKERAAREGLNDEARREKYGDINPDLHGFVEIGKAKDETGITNKEARSTVYRERDDARDESKRLPAKIATNLKLKSGNPLHFDAIAVTKLGRSKIKGDYTAGDDKGSLHRTGRAFMEGLAAVQRETGAEVGVRDAKGNYVLPDNTVIGFNNGDKVTWGEVKGLDYGGVGEKKRADAVMPDSAQTEHSMRELRNEEAAMAGKIEAAKATHKELTKDFRGKLPKAVAEAHAKALEPLREQMRGIDERMDAVAEAMLADRKASDEFSDMGTHELRREQVEYQHRIERRADDTIAGWKAAGEPYDSARVKALYKDLRRTGTGKMLSALEREVMMRETGTARERILESRLGQETDPRGPIHEAAAVHGKEGIRQRVSMDDEAINNTSTRVDAHVGEGVHPLQRSALDSAINRLQSLRTDSGAKNKIAWSVGEKARALLDNFDKLTKGEQNDMLDAFKIFEKAKQGVQTGSDLHRKVRPNVGEVGPLVNRLTEKYAGQLTKKADTLIAKAQAEGVAKLAPKETQGLIDGLTDGRKLDTKDAKLLKDANAKMEKLVAKDTDGSVRYSLMSTAIHHDLGRSGYAATHDSPHKFDGKFDWRKNALKGEGAMAYGAGTYLSTAEGVHRYYKHKFGGDDGHPPPPPMVSPRSSWEEYDPGVWSDGGDEIKHLGDGKWAFTDINTLKRTTVDAKSFDEAHSKLVKLLVPEPIERGKSPTYHVSVDAHDGNMLDWDAKLSAQSAELEDRAINAMWEAGVHRTDEEAQAMTGKEIYRAIQGELGSDHATSDLLQKHGIVGHQFAAEDGANRREPNMVIYDDSKISTNYVHFSREGVGDGKVNAAGKLAVQDYVRKVLGPKVKAQFANILHAGEYDTTNDILRVSVHSLDPMSTAYHESLHGFFNMLRKEGHAKLVTPLFKAAESPHVLGQLRKLLVNEPDALKQIESSPEERAAYMYQFWSMGKLNLSEKPATVLGHIADAFRRVLGLMSNDQRALHIMDYFQSGEFAKNMSDRNAVSRALSEGTARGVLKSLKTMAKPLADLGTKVAAMGDSRLRDTGIPALSELADKVYKPLTGQGEGEGYLPAARRERTTRLNALVEALDGYTPEQLSTALDALQSGTKPTGREERMIHATVRKTLDNMYEYMQKAGVQMGDLGYGKDYFPRVWDSNYILNNSDAFKAMLQKYVDAGTLHSSPEKIMATLTRTFGSDLTETMKPGMQFSKERVLAMIRDEDAAPFMRKNLHDIMAGYIGQATRRAEWARAFGDDGKGLISMFTRAEREGASPADLRDAMTYLRGVDGTLGDTMDPKLRRAFGNAIVYQNLRLLPLSIFSSMIDAGGIKVRGGTWNDSFRTFMRGFKEIPKGLSKSKGLDRDAATMMAEQLGVIDSAVLQHTIGSTFGQGMTGDTARKVNDAFFRFNLMEQYNRSMRVGATQAALGFLARHADGTASAHSERWLAELGLRPGEVKTGPGGEPLLTREQFKSAGMSDTQADVMADKMAIAVNKWVDGAVLRPNAAHKPIWMNDPHFALIAHLKQFVYSFQETILKRVVHEAKYANYGPAAALAAYVPFMIAADAAKGLILGGGSQPSYKDGWDAEDYLWSGMQRTGLFGVGQIGIDSATAVHRGGIGLGALAGPTLEQLGDAVSVIGGNKQFGSFVLNALPANQLFDAGAAMTRDVED